MEGGGESCYWWVEARGVAQHRIMHETIAFPAHPLLQVTELPRDYPTPNMNGLGNHGLNDHSNIAIGGSLPERPGLEKERLGVPSLRHQA